MKEISSILGVSECTIRTHIARLKLRLDCQDLLHLRFLHAEEDESAAPRKAHRGKKKL